MPHANHSLSIHKDFEGFLSCFDSLDDYCQRRRCWGPMQAMISVFAILEPGLVRSYADGCEQMFHWVGKQLGLKTIPAKSGLTTARRSVTKTSLNRLWDVATSWTADHQAELVRLVPGRAMIGFDGTTAIMPRTASISAAFKIRRDRDKVELSHYPEALLTSCWDLDSRMPVAWRLASVSAKGGERAMAASMLSDLPEHSITVMDSGYPSRDMLGDILAHGHDPVIRMVAANQGSWPEVQAFLAMKTASAWIDTVVGSGKERRVVAVRYVLRTFHRGRPQRGQTRKRMVVATTLPESVLTDEQVIGIYRQRWTIETIHDELKNLSDLETWHSTTKQGIEQEVLCHMLWHLLAGHISSHLEAEQRAREPDRPIRASTPRVMRAVASIADWLLESIGQPEPVVTYLRDKAAISLEAARKSLVTRRTRKSRPRKAFHPYAKPRRNHGD